LPYAASVAPRRDRPPTLPCAALQLQAREEQERRRQRQQQQQEQDRQQALPPQQQQQQRPPPPPPPRFRPVNAHWCRTDRACSPASHPTDSC